MREDLPLRAGIARVVDEARAGRVAALGAGRDQVRVRVVANGYANLPEESTYGATLTDGDGDMLSGSEQYKIHFPAGQLPP